MAFFSVFVVVGMLATFCDRLVRTRHLEVGLMLREAVDLGNLRSAAARRPDET